MTLRVKQAQLVHATALEPGQAIEQLALFDANGQPVDLSTAVGLHVAAHVAPVTTVNATDLATAQALANANKVAINALITSLIAAGLMAAS